MNISLYLQLLFYLRTSAGPGEHGVWAREDAAHSSRQGGEVIPDYLSITDDQCVQVYDIAFSKAGGGRDMFASVGADGSVRMFDLR